MATVLQSKLLNLACFNAFWLGFVLGHERLYWVVLPVFLVYLAAILAKQVIGPVQLLLPALLGILVDSLLALLGVFDFGLAPGVLPLWMYMLWFNFALVLPVSLEALGRFLPLTVILGAIFAPLNYLLGERIGAVDFGLSTLASYLLLAAIWACLLPALFLAEKHARRQRLEVCET